MYWFAGLLDGIWPNVGSVISSDLTKSFVLSFQGGLVLTMYIYSPWYTKRDWGIKSLY